MNTLREGAIALAARGWFVIPLKPKGKTPQLARGFKNATIDKDKICAWYRTHPRANIGVYPGPSGLIVFDLDGPAGFKTAEEMGLLKLETLRAQTGRADGGIHLYFRHPKTVVIPNLKFGGIDVRADNGYVVAPPSIHANGSIYKWINDHEPAELPAEILRLLSADGRARGETPPLAVDIGGRNNALTSLAGQLRRMGMEAPAILDRLSLHNAQFCEPPLAQQEVEAIARGIERYAPEVDLMESPSALIDEFNDKYAVVRYGGKTLILEESERGVTFFQWDAFRQWNAPRKVMVGDKARPAADYWLSHPKRREFNRIEFLPGATVPPDTYNLWRGWGVVPIEGDVAPFLRHVREVLADGNEMHAEYILQFFADIFQNPGRKIGTAIVLRGKQGTGKSIVGAILARLLGIHMARVSNARFITGHFNQHLEGLLLLVAEEAFWAGDKAAEGTLKDLVTADTITIERKGLDAIQAKSYVRLLVTSNHDWVVPAGMEERRFAVFDVSDARMQDTAYFAALMSHMENGGYEALLKYFLEKEVDESFLRHPPLTVALTEQKISSFTPTQEWLYEILQTGMIPGDYDGDGVVTTDLLFNHFHSLRGSQRNKSSDTKLGMYLVKTLKLAKTKLYHTNHNNADPRPSGRYSYEFPPLPVARRMFGERLGCQWDEQEDWAPWEDQSETF